jgi:hypothetical protein
LIQKPPDWLERKRLTPDQKAEMAKVKKEKVNQHKPDMRDSQVGPWRSSLPEVEQSKKSNLFSPVPTMVY